MSTIAGAFLALGVLVGCASPLPGPRTSPAAPAPAPSDKPDVADAGSAEREDAGVQASRSEKKPNLYAIISTGEGSIECKLFPELVPRTVENFVGLATGRREWTDPDTMSPVTGPFYSGVVFHRVIPKFMIQTGDRTGTGHAGPGFVFDDEFTPELSHDRPGILSMANRGPNTNGSQFFITLRAAPHLNGRHSVFGHCEDLDVVRLIASLPTDPYDRPENPTQIQEIRFEEREEE
jgi:peptidyl-prolyl cis-trans isomerase A (cyclophilin A)